jgi:hypothetical protein
MTNQYRVEILSNEAEAVWTIAARQPMPGEARKMDYGAADNLSPEEAANTAAKLGRSVICRVVAK